MCCVNGVSPLPHVVIVAASGFVLGVGMLPGYGKGYGKGGGDAMMGLSAHPQQVFGLCCAQAGSACVDVMSRFDVSCDKLYIYI